MQMFTGDRHVPGPLRAALLASGAQRMAEGIQWRDAGGKCPMGSSVSISGALPKRTPTNGWQPPVTPRRRLRSVRWRVASSASTYLRLIAEKRPSMNKYGLLAREHWSRHAPSRYAALEDPEQYFTELGETAAAQIEQMTVSLERSLPTDLEYLDRVAQLRAIQKQAEDAVLSELVYSVEPEPSSLADELETMLSALPSASMIEDQLQSIREEAEEEAEREGFSTPILSDEQEARVARLEKMLPLVQLEQEPAEMDETSLTNRILALREFWSPETTQ